MAKEAPKFSKQNRLALHCPPELDLTAEEGIGYSHSQTDIKLEAPSTWSRQGYVGCLGKVINTPTDLDPALQLVNPTQEEPYNENSSVTLGVTNHSTGENSCRTRDPAQEPLTKEAIGPRGQPTTCALINQVVVAHTF